MKVSQLRANKTKEILTEYSMKLLFTFIENLGEFLESVVSFLMYKLDQGVFLVI